MHVSLIADVIAKGEFSMKFVDVKGQVIIVEQCVCTSVHSLGLTFNIKLIPSGEIRKVNRFTIIELNSLELHL